MTTMEKLFAQIFERKDSIIHQIQQQADSYTQHLASTLLIDGITPPTWLLSPNSASPSSDPNELEKEEIISKLLLRPPRYSTRYSTGGHSRYYRPVVDGGNSNKPLSTGKGVEAPAPNTDVSISNELNLGTFVRQDDDIVGGLDCVPELDGSAKSPQSDIDARIASIYAAQDTSLARIQRSKSRQKARELRSNGKASAKSCSSNENRTHVSVQDKCPLDMSRWNDKSGATSKKAEGNGEKGNDTISHSCRLAKSSSSYEMPNFDNELNKTGSSSDKEELDGGFTVGPTGDSLQQSCHVEKRTEDVDLPDVCLGSYAGEKSISGKTHGTQSQDNLFCGRVTRSRSSSQQISGIITRSRSSSQQISGIVTRSRSSSQQISGIKKSSKLGTSSISNKLSDAVETAQVISDINAETQANCSIEGVLKPVTSSHIVIEESSLGANRQENAEIVVVNSSGVELDPVILRMESEGLAIKQPSECCINVKPKQLNFDEIDKCDSNEMRSSLSKKRKLDASSVDHQSSCNIFEQQLPKAIVMSSSPATAKTCSYNNTDESAKDEMKNIGLDTNEDLVVEDVEHNTKFSLHDDIDATDEDDFGHIGKDSAAGIYIPISNIESSSLSKQGNNVTEDCLDKEITNQEQEVDLDSSKSKAFEVETNTKLPNTKLGSAKINTWPLNQQKSVVDQPNCFSESREFRAHIQRDAVRCDLESPESGLNFSNNSAKLLSSEMIHLTQSDENQSSGKRLHDKISSINGSFTSSLSKQGNDDFGYCFDNEGNQPEVDLDSSRSNKIVVGTNFKLPNMNLSSAKANNTWPLNQQKNVVDQPNCFSDSRDFRVHIQRDAIRCDLESPKNGFNLLRDSASTLSSENIHLTHSDKTQSSSKGLHDEKIRDLSKGTESLLEIQAAEEIVTEVDNDDNTGITDILKESEPTCALNSIKNAADDSTYSDVLVTDINDFNINIHEWVSSFGSAHSSQNDANTIRVSDKTTPVYESFIIDDDMGNNEGGIDFDTLDISTNTIDRASIIEQICKSASMQTPLSQFTSTYQQHQVEGLYGFMVDHMDLGTNISVDEDSRKNLQTSDTGITKIDSVFPQLQKFDYATPFSWQSKNHYSSPVGKFWERSASSSGSSGKLTNSNPDLTCFPIEEDPTSNEENDELEEKIIPDVENENPIMAEVERKENDDDDDEVATEIQEPLTEVCSKHGNYVSKSSMKYPYRYSSNSVSIEASVPRTRNKVKYKAKLDQGIKARRFEEDKRTPIATRASNRGDMSVNSINKSCMRSGIPRQTQKEGKRNNIVSNITSFIPIVQQKQAAAICPGKREVKVKALEAAEAAKRRELERENERKLKKEELKLKRARIEEENAKERVLNLQKQELKKKEADIAAKKRQREDEERKQLAKKRKLVGKLEPVKQKNAGSKKISENQRQNRNADDNSFNKQDTGLRIQKTLANVASVPEIRDASKDHGEKDKVTSVHEKTPVKVMPENLTSQENSYDISPYQCSDDEVDETDNDLPTKKFVPSWASKNSVAMVLPLQQKLDPESIFPVDGFCRMDEVLLPRRLQAQ